MQISPSMNNMQKDHKTVCETSVYLILLERNLCFLQTENLMKPLNSSNVLIYFSIYLYTYNTILNWFLILKDRQIYLCLIVHKTIYRKNALHAINVSLQVVKSAIFYVARYFLFEQERIKYSFHFAGALDSAYHLIFSEIKTISNWKAKIFEKSPKRCRIRGLVRGLCDYSINIKLRSVTGWIDNLGIPKVI